MIDPIDPILRKYAQKDCPMCLDISYTDAEGVVRYLFDVCTTHLAMGLEEQFKKEKE
jgi:hypothetical protein